MKIKLCTITGADDSVAQQELKKIAADYPFVEWGILMSQSARAAGGVNRFPSEGWMHELFSMKSAMNLSSHLCGSWLRTLVKGGTPDNWWKFAIHCQRIQLNFHGHKHEPEPSFYERLRGMNRQIIFQYEGVNDELFVSASKLKINAVPIFDLSHGTGVLPDAWPKPFKNVLCTYAGGLGPANIEEQLKKINDAVGDRVICIDMETHVRSNMDKDFDLKKVTACLQIASKYAQ